MAKSRGVFQILIKSFLSGIKSKQKPRLMGEDFYGTKYFEDPTESRARKKQGRYFEPVNKDEFDQEMPAEWEAWLRYRRKEPPTKEEVEINYQMILTKRENAAKLELEYRKNKDTTALKVRGEQHSSASFPVYEEYKSLGKK